MLGARTLRSLRLAAVLAAGVSLGNAAHAAGVPPKSATHVQREQAQSRFLRGKELYHAKRYDAALAEFSASLDIVSSPNTRLYVARCLREMNRLVAAYAELGRTVVEAKELAREDRRYAKTASAAENERKRLEPKLGYVNVTVAHAASNTTLKVGGDEISRGGWSQPVPVVPGTTEVVVETPGHDPVRKSVQTSAGGTQTVAIDAAAGSDEAPVAASASSGEATPGETAPAETTRSSSRSDLRPYAYVAGGVALAGLATFTVFGLLSNGKFSDLQAACGDNPCPPGHEDEISAGKTQQTIANIGLGVFAIGAAVGVTLFVVSGPKKSSTDSAANARIVVRGSQMALEGRF